MKTCKNCGNTLADDALFCNECGKKVNEEPTEIKKTVIKPIQNETISNYHQRDYVVVQGRIQEITSTTFETIINDYSSRGYDYVSMNTFIKYEKAGCGSKQSHIEVQYYVLVFKKR